MFADWQRLESSTIRRSRYDIETGQLEIEFSSGKVYTFEGVPLSTYSGLLDADSPGSYFNQYIKGQF